MKKTALTAIMICSIAIYMMSCVNISSGSGEKITGNRVAKEVERGMMDFEAINVSGSIDVIISESTDAPVKVSGDENLLDYVETYVKDGTLNVHFKKNIKYSSGIGLRVTVPNSGKINKISASGSSDVIIEGCLVADNISINISGSSDVKGNIKAETVNMDTKGSSNFKGNIEAKTFNLKCSGSSNCTISGKAENCNISTAGSCDFKGYDFVVDKLKCNTSGSSKIQITCNEELEVATSGSSDIYYKGTGKVVSVKTSGSSNVRQK